MRILELKLKNFGCFEACTVRPAPRFTLLIGDNGSGKTVVLDALAVAAGSFLLGVPGANSRQINREDIRTVEEATDHGVTRVTAGEAEVSTAGEIEGSRMRWYRSRRNSVVYTTRKTAGRILVAAARLVRRAKLGTPTTFPVLAYYGTTRLWQSLKKTKVESRIKLPRYIGYKDWLDPSSDQKRLFRWFKTSELAALENGEQRALLEAVRAAIVAMVPEARKAYWNVDCDELMIELPIAGRIQSLPFHALSEGYRNVIGMAADIGFKMATLNPHLMEHAVAETPGIVLIDAIDLHLHPSWQRQIVGRFLQTFPRVQFIATTHSPVVVQSLGGVDDALVWDLDTGQPRAVEAASADGIADRKLGAEVRPIGQ
jgi:predicted ATP-binding protein involved in virulence